jgi:hypothetical protein
VLEIIFTLFTLKLPWDEEVPLMPVPVVAEPCPAPALPETLPAVLPAPVVPLAELVVFPVPIPLLELELLVELPLRSEPVIRT